jgi:cyclase
MSALSNTSPGERASIRCMTIPSLLALAGALLLPPAPSLSPDTTLKREVLGEGIYLFRAPEALDIWTATNVVVIVSDQDVTVFDSNTRASTARLVLAEIRKITDKPVRWLINSHWHMDHWSGNAEYVRAYPGVQIVATTETRDYMQRMSPRFFANEAAGGLAQSQAALDTAVRTGKLHDGTRLTPEARRLMEADVAATKQFAAEVNAIPRVLPTVVYRDTLIFWSGRREFRLFSATGDATGSTVLYMPAEKLLVTGDVLVAPEDGEGPPPWTTNTYAIVPWLASLRGLGALDVSVIVPGQGPAFHDKAYLDLTTSLFASVIGQVHAALGRGSVTLSDVQKVVNVDSIIARYTPGHPTPDYFKRTLASLTKKAYQEALDGAAQ